MILLRTLEAYINGVKKKLSKVDAELYSNKKQCANWRNVRDAILLLDNITDDINDSLYKEE